MGWRHAVLLRRHGVGVRAVPGSTVWSENVVAAPVAWNSLAVGSGGGVAGYRRASGASQLSRMRGSSPLLGTIRWARVICRACPGGPVSWPLALPWWRSGQQDCTAAASYGGDRNPRSGLDGLGIRIVYSPQFWRIDLIVAEHLGRFMLD